MASLSRSLAFVPGIRSSSQTDARSRPPTGIIPDVSHMVVVIMTKRLGKRRKLIRILLDCEMERTMGIEPTTLRSENECRSEEHTSELQSLMRISYAVFCLTKKTIQ